MNEDFLKVLYQNVGGDKVGTYNEFVTELRENKEFQQALYKNIGGERVGTFDEFYQELGIGNIVTQPKPAPTPTTAQPTGNYSTQINWGEGTTQVSTPPKKTKSEDDFSSMSIDWKKGDVNYVSKTPDTKTEPHYGSTYNWSTPGDVRDNAGVIPGKGTEDFSKSALKNAKEELVKMDIQEMSKFSPQNIYDPTPTVSGIDWKLGEVDSKINQPELPTYKDTLGAREQLTNYTRLNTDILEHSRNLLKKDFGKDWESHITDLYKELNTIHPQIESLSNKIKDKYGESSIPELVGREELVKQSNLARENYDKVLNQYNTLNTKIELYNNQLGALNSEAENIKTEEEYKEYQNNFNSIQSQALELQQQAQELEPQLQNYQNQLQDLYTKDSELVSSYNSKISKREQDYANDPDVKRLDDFINKYNTGLSKLDSYRENPNYQDFLNSYNNLEKAKNLRNNIFPDDETLKAKKEKIQMIADQRNKQLEGRPWKRMIDDLTNSAINYYTGANVPAVGPIGVNLSKGKEWAYNVVGDVVSLASATTDMLLPESLEIGDRMRWGDWASIYNLDQQRQLETARTPTKIQGSWTETYIPVKEGISNKYGIPEGSRIVVDENKNIISFRDEDGYVVTPMLTEEMRKGLEKDIQNKSTETSVSAARGVTSAIPSIMDFASMFVGARAMVPGLKQLGLSTSAAGNVGVFGTSFAQMYGDNYFQYVLEGLPADKAALYATGKTTATALVESVIGPLEAKLATRGLEGVAARNFTKLKETLIDAFARGKITREELLSSQMRGLKVWAKEVGVENFEEFTQEGIGNSIDNYALNKDKSMTLNESVDILLSTTLITALPAAVQARDTYKNAKADIFTTSLYYSSQNLDKLDKSLENAVTEGTIDINQAAQTRLMATYVAEELETYENLTKPEAVAISGLIISKKYHEDKAASVSNAKAKEFHKTKIEEIQAKIDEVANGKVKPVVEPEVAELLDRAKKQEQNADQEPETKEVPMEEQPATSGEVREGDTQEQEVAVKGQAQETVEEVQYIIPDKSKLKINEKGISASEVYAADGSVKTIIEGKRDVGFLTKGEFEYYKKILDKNGIKYFEVIKSEPDEYPNNYVIYKNKSKALRLKQIAESHNGYLADKTPQEAHEIGEILGYKKTDIDAFINKRYNQKQTEGKDSTESNPALEDVESTTKALEDKKISNFGNPNIGKKTDIDAFINKRYNQKQTQTVQKSIEDFYLKAKEDGSDPEFVKIVEEFLIPQKPTPGASKKSPVRVESTQSEKVAQKGLKEATEGVLLEGFEPVNTRGEKITGKVFTKEENGSWRARSRDKNGNLTKGTNVSTTSIVEQLEKEVASKKEASSKITPEKMIFEQKVGNKVIERPVEVKNGKWYSTNQEATLEGEIEKELDKKYPGVREGKVVVEKTTPTPKAEEKKQEPKKETPKEVQTPAVTSLEKLGTTEKEIKAQIKKAFSDRIPGITPEQSQKLTDASFIMWKAVANTLGGGKALQYMKKKVAQIGVISSAAKAQETASRIGAGLKFQEDEEVIKQLQSIINKANIRIENAKYQLRRINDGTISKKEKEYKDIISKMLEDIGEDTYKTNELFNQLKEEYNLLGMTEVDDLLDTIIQANKQIKESQDRIDKINEINNELAEMKERLAKLRSESNTQLSSDADLTSILQVAEQIVNNAIDHLTELNKKGFEKLRGTNDKETKKQIQETINSNKRVILQLTKMRKDPKFSLDTKKEDSDNILKVFHGTSKDKDFKKFKDSGKGIFVTVDPKEASEYSEQNDGMKFGDYDPSTGKFKEINTASRVIPLNVNLGNSYKLTDEDFKYLNSKPNYGALQKSLHQKLKNEGYDSVDYGKGVYAILTEGRLNNLLTNEVMFSSDNEVFRGVAIQLANGQNIIAALEKPLPSTLMHELSHAMIEEAITPEERQAIIDEYNEVFGDNTTEWNTDTSEYFARLYERFLSNGRKLTEVEVKNDTRRNLLQQAFDTFTELVKELQNALIEYTNTKGIKKTISLSPAAQSIFDRVTGINQQQNIQEDEKQINQEVLNQETGGPSQKNLEKGVLNTPVEKAIADLINDPGSAPFVKEEVAADLLSYLADIKVEIAPVKVDCKK